MATPPPKLFYTFRPAKTSLCGASTLKLTAPSEIVKTTVEYDAKPMIGQAGATPNLVIVRVPAHCLCYALEIQSAASLHHVDPFDLAGLASHESGFDQPCGSMDPLHNGTGIGFDGHGHGLFQIDDRWHPDALTPSIDDPNVNANDGAQVFSDFLNSESGDVSAALHDYNAGSRDNASIPPDYATLVMADTENIEAQGYNFACATKDVTKAFGTMVAMVLRGSTCF